jgi:Cu+-exporting ATPase
MNALTDTKPAEAVDLSVAGMHCASCVGRVERALLTAPGVTEAAVNLATERARVFGTGLDAGALADVLKRAGYEASPVVSGQPQPDVAPASRRELWHVLIGAALAAPLVVGMAAHLLGLPFMLPGWVQFALATPVQFWLGARFYAGAWKALRAGSANMDLLVALGTSAAPAPSSTCRSPPCAWATSSWCGRASASRWTAW